MPQEHDALDIVIPEKYDRNSYCISEQEGGEDIMPF